MWVDALLGVVLLISVVTGYQKGLVQTLLHTAGWLLSIVLGFLFYPKITGILAEKTRLYDTVHALVESNLAAGGDETVLTTASQFPAILSSTIQSMVDSAAGVLTDALSSGLTQIVLNLIAFLVIVAGTRLVFLFLTFLFSKKSNDGITGMLDGLAGALFGAARGVLMIALLLALLVPLFGLTDNGTLSNSLSGSIFAQYLYDNNLLFLIFK